MRPADGRIPTSWRYRRTNEPMVPPEAPSIAEFPTAGDG
jgi:hypothetical protein